MSLRLPRRMQALGRPAVLAFGTGMLMAMGQAPASLWPVALAGLIGLTWLVSRAESPRLAALLGWAGGAGQFALALAWIVEPFFVDIGHDGWMAPFGMIGLAGGLALFWGLAGAFAGWAGGGPRRRALAFALALAAVELARGYVLTGFPWALPGHIWIGTPLMQVAALVGQYGLTLTTTLAAALPLLFPLGPGRALGALLAAAMLSGAGLWGAWRADAPLPPAPDAPQIRLVQPNAAQRLKWRRDMIPVFWERQLAYTAAPSDPPPDLVIWPETSVPFMLERAGDALAVISDTAGGRPVIAGIQRGAGWRTFNSLVVIGPGGALAGLYDKHHLVPFGEYIPMATVAAELGLKGLAADDVFGFAPGPGPRLLDLGSRLGKALPLICYEAVFPQDLRTAERPDWLVQITNDAWFGTWAGPYQHLALARLRAVEQGLPLLRAANTGVSAVIDAHGGIVDSLKLGRAGYLTAALPAALPETPYVRTGDWPVALVLLAGLVALVATRRRNSH